MIKYLIIPGHIGSQHDLDRHYISPTQLIELYKVDPRECKIADLLKQPESFRGINLEDYYLLIPKYDGDYSLPTMKGKR